jgi:hypothetical protein
MLAAANKNKQMTVRNREDRDVRFGLAIMRAEAAAFLPGSAYGSQYFQAPFWVAHASSRAGEGVLGIADFSPCSIQNHLQSVREVCFGATLKPAREMVRCATCAFTYPAAAPGSDAALV